MEKFDYAAAVAELEKIATMAQDPSTGLDALDKEIKRSEELIKQCREYLRSSRDKIDNLGK